VPVQFLVRGSVSVVNIMIHALITLVAAGSRVGPACGTHRDRAGT
jgi:hypothetical protein